jgi:two-component system, NarL family, response regulator YdfI
MVREHGGGAIRVLAAAASATRLQDLELLVRDNGAFRLVGSVSVLSGLALRARDLEADVILVDLPIPDANFTSTAAGLDQAGVAVVALTDEVDAIWTARMLRAGVRGLVARQSTPAEIHFAIQAAGSGMVLLDPDLARALAARRGANIPEGALDFVEELTPREIEVLRMMAEGLGNKEIAVRLGISDHTVKFHISSILAKVGASSRTEAVTIGIRMGLVLL